ncbi:MAG: hypothetical protein U0359_11105 [Byssovorax sp.]
MKVLQKRLKDLEQKQEATQAQFVVRARSRLEQGKYGIVGASGETLLIDEWLGSYCESSRVKEAYRGHTIRSATDRVQKRQMYWKKLQKGNFQVVEFDL